MLLKPSMVPGQLRYFWLAALVLLLWLSPASALAVAPIPQGAPPDGMTIWYFPETGHSLSGNFKAFFDAHGGLDIFGFPRTEAVQENGFAVQYFQRARMEWHPELNQVQLTLLGSMLTAGRTFPRVPWRNFDS